MKKLSEIRSDKPSMTFLLGDAPLDNRVAVLEKFGRYTDESPYEEELHGGLYTRERSYKARTITAGALHKTDHVCVLLQGELVIWTNDGKMEQVKAPHVFRSKKGIRRLVFFLEDSVWLNVHRMQEDAKLADIEDLLLIKSEQEYLEFKREMLIESAEVVKVLA